MRPTLPELLGLRERGVRRLRLPGRRCLSAADAAETAQLIRLLRDSVTARVELDYRARIDLPADVLSSLTHLPPPSESGAAARTWQAAHTDFLLYWRRGPGFRKVSDRRPDAPYGRYVIHEPAEVELFDRLSGDGEPVQRGAPAEFVEELISTRLAVQLDDLVIGVVPRMISWPVPALRLP